VLKNPPDAAAIRQESMTTVAVPAEWRALGAAASSVSASWLTTFGDDQLTAAVVEAIAHNADLQASVARVEQARLYAKLAGARLYPSVELLARGGGKMSGDQSGLQGGVLSATWEVDVWGRVRYGRAAAAAEALATQADFEYARQSLAAQVAKTWFLITEAELQVQLARGTVEENEQMVRLTEARVRIGPGTDEDVYVARAALGTYLDAVRQIEQARDDLRRALEILLGRYPAAAIAVSAGMPAQPAAVPGGLPSELLERRPDVIAAERRVAAAFNRVHEAKAARLPAIKLTTGVSSISSELFVLKERDNPIWNLGANLLAPIFTGGALKTQVEIRTAEQKAALASYAAVGLRAFNEVESALAGEIVARDREQILAQTLSHNQRALGVVRAQYKVGSTDLRFVTQRQLSLNAAQSALLRVQAEQRIQRVNLHLALGGSFEPPPPPGPPGVTAVKTSGSH
jgi:NodT family efflux transporter outer membrane factor (OMF) lipoprotein